MSHTRCKFKIDSIERTLGNTEKVDAEGKAVKDASGRSTYIPCEHYTVKMSPVYSNGDPNHENSKFWKYSPSGQFTLGTINRAAVEFMELGHEYYIDITPAPREGQAP